MSKVRVWNITDDANTDVTPHTRMVLGKVIKPGRSVLVDAERLEGATKVQREVKAGHLFIGEQLPAQYAGQKKPPRATADARIVDAHGRQVGEKVEVAHGHGEFPAAAIVAEGEKKIELTLTEEIKVEDSVELREESNRSRRHRR